MKAILIDAVAKTVREVNYANTLDHAYRLLRCDLVDVVHLDDGDVMFVDDEGLLTSDDDDSAFFVLRSNGWTFAGSGLITGDADDEGETTPCTVDADIVRAGVVFATRKELREKFGNSPQPGFRFVAFNEET
jgi:Domain of unknown function (DUF3846)